MFDGDFTPPSKSAGRPEGNCESIVSKNGTNSNPKQTFEDIKQLDSYTEKATALFAITQTEEKLKRDNIQGKTKANQTHYEVGKKVRETIKELGGTMPEDLPTPKESVSKIEKSIRSLEDKKS
jgi:DNA-damage-inducible protein D